MRLYEVAKVMYDLQEECKIHECNCTGCYCEHHPSQSNLCNILANMLPCEWGITEADIKRLKKRELAGTYACGITEWGRF